MWGHAGYGYCASHSRYFWGFRLHLLTAGDGTPIMWCLANPKIGDRDILAAMLDRDHHLIRTGQIIVADKGYAGKDVQALVASHGARLIRPDRRQTTSDHDGGAPAGPDGLPTAPTQVEPTGEAVAVMGLGWAPAGIDINQASPARAYDYQLGGWHNFPADRWVAQRAAESMPELPATVVANRAFLHRAVRYLCAAGVRQFLDLGSGIPTAGPVHEMAHAVDRQARVVYVDVDPVAAAHGDAMLAGTGTAAFVRADLRDVPVVLAAPPARRLLDFTRPVGVLMADVLHLLPDADDPAGVVARYRDAVPTGSHLVLSLPWRSRARTRPAAAPAAATHRAIDTDSRRHTGEDIAAVFAGWDLIEPGITPIGQWHPGTNQVTADREKVTDLGGVARKP